MRVCAAIVTYNSDTALLKKVMSAVAFQVEHVYVYDNASANVDDIRSIIDEFDGTLVESDTNDGIAKALNVLCSTAAAKGYEWILTLDHDTVICDNFVAACKKTVVESDKNIAIVCPHVNYVNINENEKGDTDSLFTAVEACMTSGSFMSLSAWERVGGFDEQMVIDWVDNDICTNFIIHGYEILRNNGITMDHRLGDAVQRRFLIFKLTDKQYSAFRIYHIIRNGIYYKKKYKKYINTFKISCINLITRIKYRLLYRKDPNKIDSIKRAVKDAKKMECKKIIE